MVAPDDTSDAGAVTIVASALAPELRAPLRLVGRFHRGERCGAPLRAQRFELGLDGESGGLSAEQVGQRRPRRGQRLVRVPLRAGGVDLPPSHSSGGEWHAVRAMRRRWDVAGWAHAAGRPTLAVRPVWPSVHRPLDKRRRPAPSAGRRHRAGSALVRSLPAQLRRRGGVARGARLPRRPEHCLPVGAALPARSLARLPVGTGTGWAGSGASMRPLATSTASRPTSPGPSMRTARSWTPTSPNAVVRRSASLLRAGAGRDRSDAGAGNHRQGQCYPPALRIVLPRVERRRPHRTPQRASLPSPHSSGAKRSCRWGRRCPARLEDQTGSVNENARSAVRPHGTLSTRRGGR